ncbi:MAG: hypothetical protein MI702_13930, partial [Chlorobiales bacterium]|nr:hypothetical protein [Chlorobiales bacterium]
HEITGEVRRALGLGRKSKTEYVKVAENSHDLGIVPVVILNDLLSDEDSLVGSPSLLDPCELSIQLFNQTSWYDQLLYKTNYSTLAATPFNGSSEEPEIIVGAGDVFWVPEGGEMPKWISPDTAPAEVFERRLNNLRRRIYEQAELDAGLQSDSLRELSGEAYGHRTKPVEDMARRLGKNLESFENNLDTIMIRYWEGNADFIPTVVYPKRYGVRAIRDALVELSAVENSVSLPQEVKSILASKIVFTEGFAELSDEEQDQLEQTIRDYDPLESEARRAILFEKLRNETNKNENDSNGVESP